MGKTRQREVKEFAQDHKRQSWLGFEAKQFGSCAICCDPTRNAPANAWIPPPISQLTTSHGKYKSGVAGYAPHLYKASLLCTITPCGTYTILWVHTLTRVQGPCFPGLSGTQLFQKLGQRAHRGPPSARLSPPSTHVNTPTNLTCFLLSFFPFLSQFESHPHPPIRFFVHLLVY